VIRRIDRYIWGEIAPPTLVALFLYVFLLLMNVVFEVAREAIQNHLSLTLVLQLLYYQLPQLLVVCVPMSCLLGILIGVGRMSADSELIALQAAGIPMRRLLRPIAAWGALWAGICFYFIAFVAPEGAYLHHTLRREVYLSRYANLGRLAPRTFHESLQDLLLYFEAREPDTGGFSRVFLREQDATTGVERITVARRGEFRVDRKSGQLTVFLEDGATHVRRLEAKPEDSYTLTTFATYQETRDPPGYVQSFSEPLNRHQREMTLGQLRDDIRRARAEPNEAVRRIRTGLATTNWHERFALPAAALVFAILGLPLGTINRRGGRASGFAVSLAIALLYWVVYSALHELTEAGRVHAAWLWMPNAFFLAVAMLLPLLRRPAWLRRFAWSRRPAAPRPRQGSLEADVPSAPRDDEPDTHPRQLVFPHLLDRYVGLAFLKVFLIVVVAVDLVYLLVEFRSIVEDMVDRQGSTATMVWSYLGLVLPRMTLTILPVACLVATLIGLGLMARAREDVAVRAMGVSLHRLLLPVLVLTSALSLLGFVLQDSLIPSTSRAAATLRDKLAGRAPRSSDPRQRWVMAADSRLYHYEDAGANSDALQGFSSFELDPVTFAIRSRTFADRAVWDGAAWRLENAWTRRFVDGTSTLEHSPIPAAAPAAGPDLFRQTRPLVDRALRREAEQLTRREQRERVRDLEAKGYDTTALRVALSQEFAVSLVPCLMVLIGFPFSFHVGARGSMFGIGVAIGIAALYWSFLAVFGALGTAGFLPPLLAAWAPNVFFGGFGAWVLLHLRT